MPKHKIKRLHSGTILALSCSIFLLGPGNLFGQQSLIISAPTSGTKVVPGQTITIQVSAAGASFAAVQVIGEDIGVTAPQGGPPYSFTLTIPSDVIGQKSITALGIVALENGVFSPSVMVDSETTANATALNVNYSQIRFRYPGQQMPLDVTGAFDDGSNLDVTRSSFVSYAAADSGIASVDANGVVTAVGPGVTTVSVTYGIQSARIQVIVPKSIRGDLNGDGRVDQDDVNIILAALNASTTGRFDARDLNGDGVIDILDAKILVSLCTVSGCSIPDSDTTPPVTTSVISPSPNLSGWNNSNVTVTLNSMDNEPGGTGVKQITYSATGAQTVASTVANGASASFTVSAEGITTVTFFGTDNAGNPESSKTLTIQVDKTPPTITPVRMPPPNANGWNKTNVTASFTCADSLSGLAPGSPPASTTLSIEGAGQSVTGTCTDVAGNSASSTVSGINIDKTPPTVACNARPSVLWPPNNKLVAVNASLTVSDSLSGPAGFKLVSATSNEPDSGQGDIQGFTPGTASTSGQLRAQRLGSGNGRVYTLMYSGTDKAGNSSTCAATVTVPHDQGQN
jgi:hypothetical protein